MLSYPEIRGVLAELEEEYKELKKNPQQQGFATKAAFVLAIVDRRMRKRIQDKYDKGEKKIKF